MYANEKQQQALNKDEHSTASAHVAVDQVKGFSKTKSRQSRREHSRCGKAQHYKHKCQAKDATCHRYSSQCYSKVMGEVSARVQANEIELDTVFLDTITSDVNEYWKAKVALSCILK